MRNRVTKHICKPIIAIEISSWAPFVDETATEICLEIYAAVRASVSIKSEYNATLWCARGSDSFTIAFPCEDEY
jgi:hypothetical protein